MGLVQSRRSNYDTDVFMPLFAAIQSVIGCQPYQGRVGAADTQLVGAPPTRLVQQIDTLTSAAAGPQTDRRLRLFACTDGCAVGHCLPCAG